MAFASASRPAASTRPASSSTSATIARPWPSFCAGKRVLDLCCNSGGFAVYAKALGGAEEVVGVDLDEQVIALAKQNANLNQVQVRFVQADLFPWLRDVIASGQRFDVVVLDPAKQTRDREEVDFALKRYLDMNRLALQAVAPGGIFLTCSCTGLVSEDVFLESLRRAAWQAGRTLQVLRMTGAAADHPFLLHVPEGRYLKAVFCQRAVKAPPLSPVLGGEGLGVRGLASDSCLVLPPHPQPLSPEYGRGRMRATVNAKPPLTASLEAISGRIGFSQYRFTRRTVREYTKWGDNNSCGNIWSAWKRWNISVMRRGGNQGQLVVYQLPTREEEANQSLNFAGSEGNFAGVNYDFAGGVGGLHGPEKNGASPTL